MQIPAQLVRLHPRHSLKIGAHEPTTTAAGQQPSSLIDLSICNNKTKFTNAVQELDSARSKSTFSVRLVLWLSVPVALSFQSNGSDPTARSGRWRFSLRSTVFHFHLFVRSRSDSRIREYSDLTVCLGNIRIWRCIMWFCRFGIFYMGGREVGNGRAEMRPSERS